MSSDARRSGRGSGRMSAMDKGASSPMEGRERRDEDRQERAERAERVEAAETLRGGEERGGGGVRRGTG
jgi:hypothetical protein